MDAGLHLAIFGLPKAFKGRDAVHQNAAIASWSRLDVPVMLMGRDDGVAEASARHGFEHFRDVGCTSSGTPLLSDAFIQAQARWPDRPLAYINSDIILPSSSIESFRRIEAALAESKITSYLVVARRCNLTVDEAAPVDPSPELERLEGEMATKGAWDGTHAIDFFMFSPDLFRRIPEFAVGRPGFDNWLLDAAQGDNTAIVDASGGLPLIHPLHGYQHVKSGWKDVWASREASRNLSLTEGRMKRIDDVLTHRFDGERFGPVERIPPFVPPDGEGAQAARYADLAFTLMRRRLQDEEESEAVDLAWLTLDRCRRFAPGRLTEVSRSLLRSAVSARDLDMLEDGFSCEFLERIEAHQKHGRPIWLWGAGDMARRLLELFARHEIAVGNIVASDAPPEGALDEGLGRSVFHAGTALGGLADERPFVVIASMHRDAIGRTLESLGYARDRDFTY